LHPKNNRKFFDVTGNYIRFSISFIVLSYAFFKCVSKKYGIHVNFEAFTAVIFQVEVFWVVTPCSAVVGYQHGPPKRWYATRKLHGVTAQKTSTSI